MPLFEIKEVDRQYYSEHIEPFVPERIYDMHTHVYRKDLTGDSGLASRRGPSWPSLVAKDNSIEDLMETYRLLFPGKVVTPLIFSSIKPENRIDELNGYIQSVAASRDLPALLFADPAWPAAAFASRLEEGEFLGVKVYLNLAPDYLLGNEVRIFDFLPHQMLEVLNDMGLLVMLHIPRIDRLRDPVNLSQLLEIERRYPAVQLIVAHVGRAYCPEDVGGAFDALRDTEHMVFDISANTNTFVFQELIHAVGSRRILFGSDLPVTRMRMKRICENGTYVNLVPVGLYGDVRGDINMREVSGAEADSLSFFLYEEIRAFALAADREGLSTTDIEAVFHGNARRLLENSGFPVER